MQVCNISASFCLCTWTKTEPFSKEKRVAYTQIPLITLAHVVKHWCQLEKLKVQNMQLCF